MFGYLKPTAVCTQMVSDLTDRDVVNDSKFMGDPQLEMPILFGLLTSVVQTTKTLKLPESIVNVGSVLGTV